jgi:hypothetical protein
MKTISNDPVIPDLLYKDHRIVIGRVGKGWRAMIYAPGSSAALSESPSMLEESTRDSIVNEAKRVVDARLSSDVA